MKKVKLKVDQITVDERLQQIASILVDRLINDIQNNTLDKKFLEKNKVKLSYNE